MSPDIISAEPYTGTLSPLHQTIAERRGIAHSHNQEMVKKYGWSPDGYHNWQDEDGYNREYPLPYGFRYFYRFVDLFFRVGAESGIIDALEQDFVGDEADAFYIEELFVKAQYLGMFTPGAAVTLYSDSHIAYFKRWLPGESPWEKANASRWQVTSYNTYSCGKGNNACRKLIRRWLKEKSKEDKPLSSQPQNKPADETEARVLATPPTLNTQNSDPRKDISLDFFLVSAYIKTIAPAVGSTASPSLDELAAHVGFYSPTSGMKYKVQTCKPARMAALIDWLEIYGLIGRLGADELISGIETRYGQRLKKSKRPEHDPNGTYLRLYKGVELRLKEWVSKRLIPDKKSR
jgi:hypothetical protein